MVDEGLVLGLGSYSSFSVLGADYYDIVKSFRFAGSSGFGLLERRSWPKLDLRRGLIWDMLRLVGRTGASTPFW
jgi:hypothetical protein